MHRLWIRTAVWAVVLTGVSASTAGAAGWAESCFAEKGHDFGPVPRGAKVHHDFVMTNRLSEPVTIVNVRASCGCTTGRASNTLIQPGQTTVVEAEMDTKNFVGPKATTLFVTLVTASGQEGEARLGVQSLILSDVVLNPGTIEFGAVSRGQTPSQVLTIDRVGSPSWKAERMVSSSRAINAKLQETVRNGSNVGYVLTVSLRPDAPAGMIRDEIRILTNDAESPSIPIMITGMIRGELTAKPSLLAMGNVASTSGVQGRFLVMGTKPFIIQSVEGATDGFRIAPLDPKPKTVHVVSISYRPEEGKTRGDLRHPFRIVTNLPGEPPLDVMATLHVAP